MSDDESATESPDGPSEVSGRDTGESVTESPTPTGAAPAEAGETPPATKPPAGTRPPGQDTVTRGDYLGCAGWAIGFLLLACVSFAIGIALRPDNGAPEVTLVDVGPDGDGYRLVGTRDEVDDACVILYRGEDELTGQCGVSLGTADRDDAGRYAFTSSELDDGTTVAFGPVPGSAATVEVELADGTTQRARVRRSDRLNLDWFVVEASSPIAEGTTATLLDAQGNPVDAG